VRFYWGGQPSSGIFFALLVRVGLLNVDIQENLESCDNCGKSSDICIDVIYESLYLLIDKVYKLNVAFLEWTLEWFSKYHDEFAIVTVGAYGYKNRIDLPTSESSHVWSTETHLELNLNDNWSSISNVFVVHLFWAPIALWIDFDFICYYYWKQ